MSQAQLGVVDGATQVEYPVVVTDIGRYKLTDGAPDVAHEYGVSGVGHADSGDDYLLAGSESLSRLLKAHDSAGVDGAHVNDALKLRYVLDFLEVPGLDASDLSQPLGVTFGGPVQACVNNDLFHIFCKSTKCGKGDSPLFHIFHTKRTDSFVLFQLTAHAEDNLLHGGLDGYLVLTFVFGGVVLGNGLVIY